MKYYKISGKVFAYESDGSQDGIIPGNAVAMTTSEVAALTAPTLESIQSAFIGEIQARLDAFARTRNYDGILSACSYATSTDETFAAEGQAAVALRDGTWRTAYGILAQVLAAERPMPASYADIADEMPQLAWPS